MHRDLGRELPDLASLAAAGADAGFRHRLATEMWLALSAWHLHCLGLALATLAARVAWRRVSLCLPAVWAVPISGYGARAGLQPASTLGVHTPVLLPVIMWSMFYQRREQRALACDGLHPAVLCRLANHWG